MQLALPVSVRVSIARSRAEVVEFYQSQQTGGSRDARFWSVEWSQIVNDVEDGEMHLQDGSSRGHYGTQMVRSTCNGSC